MKFWKQKISYFLEEHPFFKETEENILTPRQGIKIRFWFEGNLQVEGQYDELQINFNDSDLLILANDTNIYRILWSRLVCFEIIKGKETNAEISDLLKITNLNKN
jgi:hypothetical protein